MRFVSDGSYAFGDGTCDPRHRNRVRSFHANRGQGFGQYPGSKKASKQENYGAATFQVGLLKRCDQDEISFLTEYRYRYHPPKYYRGPLHPVQPPPSSDPVARDFAPGPFNLPRLKQTLHSTIAPDLMTLAYQHKIPGTPDKPERIRLRTWGDDSPYMENRPKRGPRGADVLLPLEPTLTYHNIPEIKSIHIAAFMPLARKNQDYVTVAKSVIQSITGVRPEATEVKHSESQWNIVKGDRSGVKVSVHGHQAYELLDKMISLVFPKIKEWKGISGTTGDSAGNLAWGFTPAQMILFPEVEANYSLYPAKVRSFVAIR